MDGVGCVCTAGLIGSCHSPVAIFRPPTKTSLSLKYTLYSSLSNITLYPALQNFLVEMRDACARPGTICASVMWLGSHGILSLQVWVNLMDFPFGSVMVIGLAAGRIFTAGAPATKKPPIAPESESAHSIDLVAFFNRRL